MGRLVDGVEAEGAVVVVVVDGEEPADPDDADEDLGAVVDGVVPDGTVPEVEAAVWAETVEWGVVSFATTMPKPMAAAAADAPITAAPRRTRA